MTSNKIRIDDTGLAIQPAERDGSTRPFDSTVQVFCFSSFFNTSDKKKKGERRKTVLRTAEDR
jgi:hypothetical protein